MTVPQQELQSDPRCRLAMSSLHVPRSNVSWHWDPDALARWYTLIPACRLVPNAGRPCAEITMEFGTRADAPAGTNGWVCSLE